MTIDQGAISNPPAGRSWRATQVVFWTLAATLGLAACTRVPPRAEPPAPTPAFTEQAAPSATARQEFQVRGVVEKVNWEESEVIIRHEEIPNYMPAMTMPFEVRQTNELTGLAPRDQVKFTMIVTEDEGWIENIQKIGVSSPGPAPRPSTRVVREVEPLEAGSKMPDYTFTNSLGKTIRLSDFAGQAYAFTFIFTRCPFPNFCPRMNQNFASAYETLASDPAAPRNWHLVSISFDPDFDTPERLRKYSENYPLDPARWDWVTGAMIDIDAISEQVGMVFAFENNTFNHNLRTVVVDRNGIIRKILLGNEWKAAELAAEIIAGARAEPAAETPRP